VKLAVVVRVITTPGIGSPVEFNTVPCTRYRSCAVKFAPATSESVTGTEMVGIDARAKVPEALE
jgi:hypothetical protein